MPNQVQFSIRSSNGTLYFLNKKEVTLKGNKQSFIYYFSRDAGRETACDLPSGYLVAEGKNYLPHLKKAKAA